MRSLTANGGVAQEDIYVYDASRVIPPCLFDGPTGSYAEFPSVHYVDNEVCKQHNLFRLTPYKGGGARERVEADPDTVFLFSNTEVSNYDQTKLPTCATNADYMIAVDNFRGHNLAGITATGKIWFGSIWRPCCPDPACGVEVKYVTRFFN